MDSASSPAPRTHDRVYLQLLVACAVAVVCTLALLVTAEQRFVSQLQRQQLLIRSEVILYDVRLQLRELQQISGGTMSGAHAASAALQAFEAGSGRIDDLGRQFVAAWTALGFAQSALLPAERYLQGAVAAFRRSLMADAAGRSGAAAADRPAGQFTSAIRVIEIRLASEARRVTASVNQTYRLDRVLLAVLLVWATALVLLTIAKYRRRLRLPRNRAFATLRAEARARGEELAHAADRLIHATEVLYGHTASIAAPVRAATAAAGEEFLRHNPPEH
jgi:hypothetical protein